MVKRIIFVIPYPLGESPSQRFRFEQYLSILQSHNYNCEIHSFWSISAWRILYKNGHTLKKFILLLEGFLKRMMLLFFSTHSADYVFIHREATPVGPPLFEWITATILRKKIIYDFDDAIWLPNTSEQNKLISKIKWTSKVKLICQLSHKVSAGNEYLCAFARQYNASVFLNPTTIDVENLHTTSIHRSNNDTDIITIGWTGTHSTLPYLTSFKSIFQQIENKYPNRVRLLVIADKKPQLKIDSLQFLPWTKTTEITDLLRIDIGIMPLTDNEWDKGKCGFKILQYMALGIPAVASPVGVNIKIIEHGKNGYLCESPEEWIQSLEKLITSHSLREKIGKAGREDVIARYSVLSNCPNFLSLFE